MINVNEIHDFELLLNYFHHINYEQNKNIQNNKHQNIYIVHILRLEKKKKYKSYMLS